LRAFLFGDVRVSGLWRHGILPYASFLPE